MENTQLNRIRIFRCFVLFSLELEVKLRVGQEQLEDVKMEHTGDTEDFTLTVLFSITVFKVRMIFRQLFWFSLLSFLSESRLTDRQQHNKYNSALVDGY